MNKATKKAVTKKAVTKKAAGVGPSIGDTVFIRTVTMSYTGCIVGLSERWIQIAQAAWVADTGRFADAMATGTLSEVEPYPDGIAVLVAVAAVVDVSPWSHALPRTQV
jgi:hypothetical protein